MRWHTKSFWIKGVVLLVIVAGAWWISFSIWRHHRNNAIESAWMQYVMATGFQHILGHRVDRDPSAELHIVMGNGPLITSDQYGNTTTIEHATGYADASGNVVIEPRFHGGGQFSEGLAWATEGKGIGYINSAGEWAIKPQFYDARSFHDGRARIRELRDDGYGVSGYIDPRGRIVIPIEYDSATDFFCGYALVGEETFLSSIWTSLTGHLEGLGSRHANLSIIDVEGREVDPEQLLKELKK
jgi:hypothetical protein